MVRQLRQLSLVNLRLMAGSDLVSHVNGGVCPQGFCGSHWVHTEDGHTHTLTGIPAEKLWVGPSKTFTTVPGMVSKVCWRCEW